MWAMGLWEALPLRADPPWPAAAGGRAAAPRPARWCWLLIESNMGTPNVKRLGASRSDAGCRSGVDHVYKSHPGKGVPHRWGRQAPAASASPIASWRSFRKKRVLRRAGRRVTWVGPPPARHRSASTSREEGRQPTRAWRQAKNIACLLLPAPAAGDALSGAHPAAARG